MFTYPMSIQDAADILDDIKPGWYNLIDLEILDMGEAAGCILGQLYGSYSNGLFKLFDIVDAYEVHNGCIILRDEIFGVDASISEWADEIEMRKETDSYFPDMVGSDLVEV